MTELYNVTSFLDASSITEGIGVPPVLVMGVILMAVYLHTRNVMPVSIIGGVFTLLGVVIGIENIYYIGLLIMGMFIINIISEFDYDSVFHTRRRKHSWDITMDLFKSEDSTNPNFITKILLVFGLAHKKEIKSNDKP